VSFIHLVYIMIKTIIGTLTAVILIALFIPFVVNKDFSILPEKDRNILQIWNNISTDEIQFVAHSLSEEKKISEIFIPNTNQKIKISIKNGKQLLNNGWWLSLVAVFENFFWYKKFYLPIDLIAQEKYRLEVWNSDIDAVVDYVNTEYMIDGICSLFSETQPCIFDGKLVWRTLFLILPSNVKEIYDISIIEVWPSSILS
jgi:hypothetical protein